MLSGQPAVGSGTWVGACVGAAVGASVGAAVGAGVCVSAGVSVGASVGAGVASGVGSGVLSGVGSGVGSAGTGVSSAAGADEPVSSCTVTGSSARCTHAMRVLAAPSSVTESAAPGSQAAVAVLAA